MNYYKELTTGAVVKAPTMPAGAWWREVTEREYKVYRARVARAMGYLEKAVEHKARLLGSTPKTGPLLARTRPVILAGPAKVNRIVIKIYLIL